MAKKDKRQALLHRGLETLRQRGLPTHEVSPAAVALLTSHFGNEPESDLAIVYLLGGIADARALEALTSLEPATSDKEIKKEIQRSFYRLAQKGIAAPEPAEAGAHSQKPIFRVTPEIEGYLSSVDGAGGRLVWLAKPQAGSGIQLLQGMVGDREGLAQVGGTVMPRRELRRIAQEIKERHGVTMIAVPWEYADLLLYEGFEKAQKLGRTGVENFSSLRAIFNTAKPKISSHPVYDRLQPDEARSGAWRELSRRLLKEAEFRLWLLDEDWMKPYLEQMQEAQQSRLVLNEVQKEERLAAIVRDAVREIFVGETGRLLQRRMEDMALYLLETKREQQAQLALAVALELGEGLGLLDISFLTGLVQKSLAFYLSRIKEKAAEEPALIVKP
ncbi:MAG: hypothetical protein ACREP8_05570 [Candidatus Binatia bacterium]